MAAPRCLATGPLSAGLLLDVNRPCHVHLVLEQDAVSGAIGAEDLDVMAIHDAHIQGVVILGPVRAHVDRAVSHKLDAVDGDRVKGLGVPRAIRIGGHLVAHPIVRLVIVDDDGEAATTNGLVIVFEGEPAAIY